LFSQLFSSHPSTDQPFTSPRNYSQLISVVLHARKLLLLERNFLHKEPTGHIFFLHIDTWDVDTFKQKSLSQILCTTKLAQNISQYYFVLQSLHKAHSNTILYYKAYTKHFLILLCNTKLHKILPNTILYYKTCTKQHLRILLCTTMLAQDTSQYYFDAQGTSQYYFVLQSLYKALPSTTLYYKACTNHFPAPLCITQSLRPVLLCTTKLAKSTSQYHFVLRSLRKALPSTTLYYKPCTKYVPVLLCDTKFAQTKLLHTASSFAEKLLHTASFLNREAFTHRSFYTQQAFTQRSFYTQQAFTHSKRLHTVLLHMASVYTQKLLHKDAFTHRSFYTQTLWDTDAFTHRSFCV